MLQSNLMNEREKEGNKLNLRITQTIQKFKANLKEKREKLIIDLKNKATLENQALLRKRKKQYIKNKENLLKSYGNNINAIKSEYDLKTQLLPKEKSFNTSKTMVEINLRSMLNEIKKESSRSLEAYKNQLKREDETLNLQLENQLSLEKRTYTRNNYQIIESLKNKNDTNA